MVNNVQINIKGLNSVLYNIPLCHYLIRICVKYLSYIVVLTADIHGIGLKQKLGKVLMNFNIDRHHLERDPLYIIDTLIDHENN